MLALAGCGGGTTTSTSTTPASTNTAISNGASSYVGQATNAEIFIQWTRAGASLSGSLQEAIRKERDSAEVESSSRAFTGTIVGNGLTLTLNEGLGSTTALVGQMTTTGFTMTFPATGHELTNITFVPGKVSDYNHAVAEIEGRAEQGGEATSTTSTGGFAVHVEQCPGTISDHGAELKVTTDNGVGCPEARAVFVDYLAGKGEQRESAAAGRYAVVDGWTCGRQAHGFGCGRSGAYISATTG